MANECEKAKLFKKLKTPNAIAQPTPISQQDRFEFHKGRNGAGNCVPHSPHKGFNLKPNWGFGGWGLGECDAAQTFAWTVARTATKPYSKCLQNLHSGVKYIQSTYNFVSEPIYGCTQMFELL